MICTKLDDFIIDKDDAYWHAELSDGTRVYQDDNRPEYEEKIAWYRLKKYCEINNLYPIKMWITFRSHTEFCGESQDGFFFSLGLFSSLLSQKNRYIIGPIIDGKIHVRVWTLKEVLEEKEESEIRNIEGYEDRCISRSLMDMNVHNNTT